mgnify:CR=1 FL=1
MKIISFAWTTPALLAGEKTVTRREWSDDYAARFRVGELVAAYDRNPRFKGRQVAVIRLTEKPVLQSTADAPDADWEREGFKYLQSIGARVNGHTPAALWELWRHRSTAEEMYVVRFEVVRLVPPPPSAQATLSLPGGAS